MVLGCCGDTCSSLTYVIFEHPQQRNLFVCEFKFKRQELSIEIIEEMKEKISRMEVPRGFAVVPVLFHLCGVSEAVEEKQCFYRVIDIGQFLDLSAI